MARSADQLTDAQTQSEAWLEAVNPHEVPEDALDNCRDLRQIGMALLSLEAADQALVRAVAHARARKRSWTEIANVLGVSRLAAHQRFAELVALTQLAGRPATVAPDLVRG